VAHRRGDVFDLGHRAHALVVHASTLLTGIITRRRGSGR
jgi:hypothetical protein